MPTYFNRAKPHLHVAYYFALPVSCISHMKKRYAKDNGDLYENNPNIYPKLNHRVHCSRITYKLKNVVHNPAFSIATVFPSRTGAIVTGSIS